LAAVLGVDRGDAEFDRSEVLGFIGQGDLPSERGVYRTGGTSRPTGYRRYRSSRYGERS
jgi:hypothetical protein